MPKGKVVHLSSVHPSTDTRVFHKECRSLAEAGYDVTLVARARGDEIVDGVQVRAVTSNFENRIALMVASVLEVTRLAVKERGDIYHLHDPELLPVGGLLKLLRKKVIFDAHEHVSKQLLTKPWIPPFLRKPVSKMYRAFEWCASHLFLDAVVVADPTLEDAYPPHLVTVVENFPLRRESLQPGEVTPYADRPARVAYVGAITELRGIWQMVDAVTAVNQKQPDAILTLAGVFSPPSLREEICTADAEGLVEYRGVLNRRQVYELYNESRIGIVVIHPIPNYVTSQPVKLLEYMLAGLPVVVSDFHYYRQYVEEIGCGIMVDPLDVDAIAEAITWLLEHPDEAAEMGERGKRAVLESFTWDSQATRLVATYERLFSKG